MQRFYLRCSFALFRIASPTSLCSLLFPQRDKIISNIFQCFPRVLQLRKPVDIHFSISSSSETSRYPWDATIYFNILVQGKHSRCSSAVIDALKEKQFRASCCQKEKKACDLLKCDEIMQFSCQSRWWINKPGFLIRQEERLRFLLSLESYLKWASVFLGILVSNFFTFYS